MRSIATFTEEKMALRFWNYLQAIEIESNLEEDENNEEWLVWVLDEEKFALALQAHQEFLNSPDDSKFNLELARKCLRKSLKLISSFLCKQKNGCLLKKKILCCE